MAAYPTFDDFVKDKTGNAPKSLLSNVALQALEKLLKDKEIQKKVPMKAAMPLYYYFNLYFNKESDKTIEEKLDTAFGGKEAFKKQRDALLAKIKPETDKLLEDLKKTMMKMTENKPEKAKQSRFGDYYNDYLYDAYDTGYYDDNMAYLSRSSHQNRAGVSRANRINDDKYYLYGYSDDDAYDYRDDMDMVDFYNGDRARRYAGYSKVGHYYDNYGGRNELYGSRTRGRNLYHHRRSLQDMEDIDSLPMMLLFAFIIIMTVILFCMIRFYQHKKSKMVTIEANNEESKV